MKIIDNSLITEELFTMNFSCDLAACKGECCVEGDAGAPLEMEEISIIEDNLEAIKPYMSESGLQAVEKTGVFDYDASGQFVTPLVDGKECAFVYFENEIAFCSIEKAFRLGKIKFIKPISCHLYPIRIKKYNGFDVLNYHRWHICESAVTAGKRNAVSLYRFLKEPLIRKFGEEWYEKLLQSLPATGKK